MAGIAMLLPEKEMCELAENLVSKERGHVVYIKQTKIDTVVLEARKALTLGANIVIARGSQAHEVKVNTNVPVVEIGLTARELGLAIVKAKKILKKQNPLIGIFFWKGMLCDTTNFEELFNVKILRHDLDRGDSWFEVLDQAIAEGVDFLISGETCVRYARQKGIPAMVFHTTQEGIHIALKSAEKLYYMSKVEQQGYAQFLSVMDSAFNGIVKVDKDGIILLMNRVMEQIVDSNSEDVLGMHIVKVLDGLDCQMLDRVLKGEIENCSTFINARGKALVVVVDPILVDGVVTGAIVSCNMIRRMSYQDKRNNTQEPFLRGLVAKGSLDDLASRQPDLKKITELAKVYAQSSNPMLVVGKTDQELEELCQGIHNYSLRKNGPFVVVNIAGIPEQNQIPILFGDKNTPGLLIQANYGTLVIRAIDKLTLNTQLCLLRSIRRRRLFVSPIDNDYIQEIDVRVIGCASKPLLAAKKSGKFRNDLYYLLQTFCLTVPDFSYRKRDVRILTEEYTRKYMNLHSHYHILTEDAKTAIADYYWEGNDMQLEAFCECLILTAERRIITKQYVDLLLRELYGGKLENNGNDESEKEKIKNTEKEQIQENLIRYGGSRTLTAKSMNISTSTLWRKMKRYGLK